jgi:hygromycin-B 7''-O-kinase
MTDPQQRSSPLAEARARSALRHAGLDPTSPLEAASSTSNQVFLTPTHVVRVSSGLTTRLTREAAIAEVLPPGIPYPQVVARGSGAGDDWLVLERLPGRPLAHLWPALDADTRRAAVSSLAGALRALHEAPVPAALPALDHPPHLLRPGPEPLRSLYRGLVDLVQLPHVDRGLVAELARLVHEWSGAIDVGPATGLIHGDLTFENVLHDGVTMTGLLDLEWCRAGPADLDLDILLRMCAHPDLHVAEQHADRAASEDYRQVPLWLAEDHPGLVAAPRLSERLRTYATAYEVRSLLADPPDRPRASLDERHPLRRLARTAAGRYHLYGPPTTVLVRAAQRQRQAQA